MRHATILSMLILPTLLSLAACQNDGLDRPGSWKGTGVNDANLVAMVADPADLVRGRSSPNSRGNGAVPAVDRLNTDKVKTPRSIATAGFGGG